MKRIERIQELKVKSGGGQGSARREVKISDRPHLRDSALVCYNIQGATEHAVERGAVAKL